MSLCMTYRLAPEIEFSHQLWDLMNVSGSDHKNKTTNNMEKCKQIKSKENKIFQASTPHQVYTR